MTKMFDFFKPVLESVGVSPREDWDATKRQIYGQALAQLRRDDLKPGTVTKWHMLGHLTQPNPPAIVFHKTTE